MLATRAATLRPGGTGKSLILLVVLLAALHSGAQATYPDTLDHKKLNKLIIGAAAGYTVGMTALGQAWYSGFDKQSFRFFNDAKEWYQVDKAGHFFGAFQLGGLGSHALRRAGLAKGKADVAGTLASFALMGSIEIFDGHSAGYGASVSDLLANAMGASFFLGQQILWDETRIYPQFSFHTTYLANQRPEVLGSNFGEQVLKDYNGQTYWLSVDMDRFGHFPKWLNLALGYGAHDFLYASRGANLAQGLSPYRQYYLSVDFDLTGIPTRSKAVKTLIYLVNMIKLPSPTLEFSNKRVRAHAFYF